MASDHYFVCVLLERIKQILDKFSDPLRPTVVKAVVHKPPESFKTKGHIRYLMSLFDTYLSPNREEESIKAQYLLTNLISEAYEDVSKPELASDTLTY